MRMKQGRIALILLAIAIMATGCMPGASSMANPGWTVVSTQDGVVYSALASGTVLALDPTNPAAPLWSYPPPKADGGGGFSLFKPATSDGAAPLDAVYGAPVVEGDMLLVSSLSHTLYAFDRENGGLLWEFTPEGDDGALIGSVTVADGVAYFGSANGKVYALDLETRELVWSAPYETGSRIWGAAALDDANVYIGSMDHFVYALDRETGQLVWRADVGASVPGSITLREGALFVGAVDSKLHVLDADNGSQQWVTDKLDGWVWGEALISNGAVYFGTLGGKVYAYDRQTGRQLWQPVQLDGAVRAGPALLDEYIIVGTDSGAAARIAQENGAVLAFPVLEGGVLSTPAVAGTEVYVGTSVGKLYAFDVERGIAQLWVYPTDSK